MIADGTLKRRLVRVLEVELPAVDPAEHPVIVEALLNEVAVFVAESNDVAGNVVPYEALAVAFEEEARR